MVERESPAGKRVSLFVTCIVDLVYPDTGLSTVNVLEHLGVEVDFPMGQTCCGQPAFNAGYRQEARRADSVSAHPQLPLAYGAPRPSAERPPLDQVS